MDDDIEQISKWQIRTFSPLQSADEWGAFMQDLGAMLSAVPRCGISCSRASPGDDMGSIGGMPVRNVGAPLVALGFNLRAIPRAVIDAIDWSSLPVWEEVYTSLQMLAYGIEHAIFRNYAWTSQPFNEGGLSQIRSMVDTQKVIDAMIERLPFCSSPARAVEHDNINPPLSAFVEIDWEMAFGYHLRHAAGKAAQ